MYLLHAVPPWIRIALRTAWVITIYYTQPLGDRINNILGLGSHIEQNIKFKKKSNKKMYIIY